MPGMFDSYRPAWMNTPVNKPAWGAPPVGGDLNTGFNMADIRARLQGTQKSFLNTQNKMIDRTTQRGKEQGRSDMISSGLAGTTAVGGMNAAVAESAGMQKADLASRAQMQTDQLSLQYAALAQQAFDSMANRQLQAATSGGRGGGGGAGGGGAGEAAEQLMKRPSVGGGAIYGKNYAASKAEELRRLRGESGPYEPQMGPMTTGEGSEKFGMSYEQWWNNLTGSDRVKRRLTGADYASGKGLKAFEAEMANR